MSNYVTLIGAEDVARAAYVMRDAAAEMQRAASTISESNERLIQAIQQHECMIQEVLSRRQDTDPLKV